jgi:hypothetical protein
MSEANIKLYEQWEREGRVLGFGIWAMEKGKSEALKDLAVEKNISFNLGKKDALAETQKKVEELKVKFDKADLFYGWDIIKEIDKIFNTKSEVKS